MILEKRRIDWKTLLLAMICILVIYILHEILDNETLAMIFYYILLPGTIILSILKLTSNKKFT